MINSSHPPNKCITGRIGQRYICADQWAKESHKFNRRIDRWNVTTKRKAIRHPGFSVKFNYCPVCGEKV